VLEKMLPLAYEVSVLAARGADGEAVVYPIAENVHRDGILFTTTVPGPNVTPECASRAQAAALEIIHRLDYVGVLCVEFFVLKDGSLVVNEMAPRPHNSGHAATEACLTSQFEQLVRAICDLPLGSTEVVRPTAISNLLGDLWAEGEPPFEKALALDGVRLHLYGKEEARPGRKMGHLTFTGADVQAVRAAALDACDILGITRF